VSDKIFAASGPRQDFVASPALLGGGIGPFSFSPSLLRED